VSPEVTVTFVISFFTQLLFFISEYLIDLYCRVNCFWDANVSYYKCCIYAVE